MKKFLTVFVCASLFLGAVLIPFTATSAQNELGDVNRDSFVDNLDANKILKYDAGLIDLADSECELADVNSDGSVDNLDSVLILLYDAGINDSVTGKNDESSEDGDISFEECFHVETVIVNRVDATVEADGYSGDERCSLCDTLINRGIKLEKFTEYDLPLTYYIYTTPSGETLKLPKGVSVLDYTLKRANKTASSRYEAVEDEILRLVNVEREKEGIPPLANQANAYYFSLKRSAECAESTESFSHTRPDGSAWHTVFAEGDVVFMTAGENLFKCGGYPTSVLAQTSVEAWMDSPGHRANILNPSFTSVTIAIFYDEATTSYYITQLFLG